jgi:hypothetical protein
MKWIILLIFTLINLHCPSQRYYDRNCDEILRNAILLEVISNSNRKDSMKNSNDNINSFRILRIINYENCKDKVPNDPIQRYLYE